MTRTRALGLERPNRELGIEHITQRDVAQGALGDCWVLAPMSAVAEHNPAALRERVSDGGQGHAEVRLTDPRDGHVQSILIDRTYPEAVIPHQLNTANLHADTTTHSEWPAAVEKAIATTYEQGYQRLDHSGTIHDSAHIMHQLTGREPDYVSLGAGGDSIADQRTLELIRDRPAVVSIGQANKGADPDILRDRHLVENHSYSISTIAPDGTIQLYNPWGAHQPERVTLDQLRRVSPDRTVIVDPTTHR